MGKLYEAPKDCTVGVLDFDGRPPVTDSITHAWTRRYTGV